MYMTMWQISQTVEFEAWLDELRDLRARVVIAKRLERVEAGNLGDRANVGGGVSELRIHHGPGYRLYYTVRDRVVILLLAGGVKASQKRDIRRAQEMAAKL